LSDFSTLITQLAQVMPVTCSLMPACVPVGVTEEFMFGCPDLCNAEGV
jgi:hypothetical protein